MATSLKDIVAIVCLAMVSMASLAEELPDPTRPAAEFLAPQIDMASGVAAAPLEDGLRTIIISPDRRSAVINGQQVPLGGKVGEDRLMAVCEDSVVLQGAGGRREVLLYPGVNIQGRQAKHCVMPAAGLPVPKKKLNKINHKTTRSVAGKKEKSCK